MAKKPSPARPGDDGYEGKRRDSARRSRARAERGREIGATPAIEDVRRRSRCRDSLRLFCETYNPQAFSMGWSADHLRVIERIEEAARLGALYAFAMPRGSGKTTICRMAALWALSYAHRRYVFLIGANQGKAEDSLAAIRTYIRFLPEYAADFPEISHSANCLGGIANRAAGQICDGEPTMIEWGKDRVVLPTVPPPPNWPKGWPLRSDGMVPTAGSVASASGLTGDGIRGSLLTLTTGDSLRPDLCLLDDPQSHESAHSPTQNVTREELVSADVLGMAGPGKTISAVMPCTVIARDDFVDRILDRKKHPLWRGERTKLLPSMPKDLAAWEEYFDLYRACAQKEPPDFAESNAYYAGRRDELEAGAVASWPARKLPGELSAVQHAMHLYSRDPRAFAAEYQNDPVDDDQAGAGELKADEIARRLNGHVRGLVPTAATTLTTFIDVGQELLYWAACAWEEGFTGSVVDYGAWPPQPRTYFAYREANPTLSARYPGLGPEGQVYAGLNDLAEVLLGKDWPTDGGGTIRVSLGMVDSGWMAEVVERFARGSPHRDRLQISKGAGIGPAQTPILDRPRKPGERRGLNWIRHAPKPGHSSRLLEYNTNFFKSFIQSRLLAPVGAKGALTLFGDDPVVHRLFADHLTAEYPDSQKSERSGRTADVWTPKPNRDNHLWDCLVGCCVAASVEGVSLVSLPSSAPAQPRKVSWAARQREKRGGR